MGRRFLIPGCQLDSQLLLSEWRLTENGKQFCHICMKVDGVFALADLWGVSGRGEK